jgi:beta-glucosidase
MFMSGKYRGIFHCKGTNIVDESGRQFYPLGFGLGGALYPEGYMWQVFGGKHNTEKFCESPTYMYKSIVEIVGEEAAKNFWDAYLKNWLSKQDIEAMARWGANHVRLPLTYKTLTTKDGSYLEAGFEDIERIVSWCRQYGLYVVLDLHAAPGGQNAWHFCDSDGTARLWEEPEKYWPWTIHLWKEIAARYAEDPIILGYDLLNETLLPPGHSAKELRSLFAAITRAIREVDKKHIVFIEGNVYATDFTDLEPFDDNMAYSFHFYKYGGPKPEKRDIQKYLDLRYRTQIPLWNGETGDNNAKWWEEDIKLHKKHNIGICMWTHKKIHNSDQPYIIELVPEFKKVADYITGRGPRPDAGFAEKALMAQAAAMATEKCIFQPEYLAGYDWYEAGNEGPLYLDPKAPIDRRVDDLLERMTLEEKASQLANSCEGIDRLKLPPFRDGEVEHGVSVIGNEDPVVGMATVFPQAIAMAASFNEELIYRLACAISDEVRAKYSQGFMGLAFCSPVIDLARDPRWGRTQESFGEDPHLAGVLGAEFIRGLTGGDPDILKTIAGPKHITANSCEATRRGENVIVDDRSMWEYYLRPFEKCLEFIDYQTIMPAYNGINGMPGAANSWLLNSVLREMFGFSGYVLSDGGAVYDIYRAHHIVSSMEEAAALSVISGCDVSNGRGHREHIVKAVQMGLISENDVDIAARRALKARFQLGLLNPPESRPFRSVPSDIVNCRAHRDIALQTARESVVMLKNDGLLPLKEENLKKVALIGPYARNTYMGTYSGQSPHIVTLEQGLKDLLQAGAEVICVPVFEGGIAPEVIPESRLETPDGQEGILAEYFVSRHLLGTPALVKVEKQIAFDWRFRSPVPGVEGESAWSVRFSGYLNVPETRKYTFSINTDNGVRLIIDGFKLIDEWGCEKPRICTAELYLDAGTKHSIRLERYSQGEGCHVTLAWDYIDRKAWNAALSAAREADYAIVCVGTDRVIEDETTDRADITLQNYQEELVRSIRAENPNTAAVIFSGSTISSPWMAENIPSILQAWYPGEEGGTAIAEILLGKYSPSGRLPLTVYASASDIPSINCYNIIEGKSTYQYFEGEPLYPFGHGLSYSRFAYSNIECDREEYILRDRIGLQFNVKNIGPVDADEAAQVYVRALDSSVARPLKQLVGFKKLHLRRDESRTVKIEIPLEDLYRYDTDKKCKVLDSGRYAMMVGASSSDIRLMQTVYVDSARTVRVHGLTEHNG